MSSTSSTSSRDDLHPPVLVHLPKKSEQQNLNELFQNAVSTNNFQTCQLLIEQRADPNAKDANGLTPWQVSIRSQSLTQCKFLIDFGVVFDDHENRKILCDLLNKASVKPINQQMFFTPRPALGDIAILIDGSFLSLARLINTNSMKIFEQLPNQVALFNYCDESVNHLYGGITTKLMPYGNTLYTEITPYFMVARVFVNHPDQLLPLIQRIQTVFPNRNLSSWNLMGHANEEYMLLGQGKLSKESGPIMDNITKQLPPFTVLSILGCLFGVGQVNPAITLSNYTKKGQFLLTTGSLMQNMRLKIHHSKELQRAVMIPHVLENMHTAMENKQIKLYARGELIIHESFRSDALPQTISDAIESKFARDNAKNPSEEITSVATSLCSIS